MGWMNNLRGQRFGRLVVLELHGQGHNARWLCKCDCGKIAGLIGAKLRSGRVKSCGCAQHNGKHGHARKNCESPTYISWTRMLSRCHDPNLDNYKHYGGRGITVCERWLSFENFLADMGERPANRSIDRINNDGNYEPGNCRWATSAEQHSNKRQRTCG